MLQHLLECHCHGETLTQIVQKSLGQSVSDKVYFKLKEIEEERNIAMGHKDIDQEIRHNILPWLVTPLETRREAKFKTSLRVGFSLDIYKFYFCKSRSEN